MSTVCTKFKAINVFHFSHQFTAKDLASVNQQFNSVDKNENTKVLLDFSKLKYIDSTAIGLLIKYLLEIRLSRGKILLFSPMKQPLNLIKSIGVDKIFSIEFNRIKAFSKLA